MISISNRFRIARFILPALVFALSGCATTNGDPRDPLEPLNRGVYRFNDTLDKAVTKPIARGYRAILPKPVRTGVSNFFSNIDDVLVTANNLLQFKFHDAASDFARLLANTTFGIGGLFDVATSFGLEKHNEDFGQTLGYWGIGDGPFLMLPLLGPSNARDTVGSAVQIYADPLRHLDNVRVRNSLAGLRFVNARANLLDAERVLDEAALDPYTFLRDAYLQQRRSLVYDGNPPRENFSELDEPNTGPDTGKDAGKKAVSGVENPTEVTAAVAKAEPAVVTPVTQTASVAEQTIEPVSEKSADSATPTNGVATLLAWLFRGGDGAAGQE